MENRRILLIDDDERSIDAIKRAFASYEVELEIVREPTDAFERVLALHPRAIVLAVELPPQKQGYALCRRLKKTPETQTVPIVLTSSGDPYFDDHKKLAMRADAYLLKPLDGAEVIARLEAVSGPFQRVAGAPPPVPASGPVPVPPPARAQVYAEIIEVEDEDLVMPEITVVGIDVSAALELRGEDMLDPRRGAAPAPSSQAPRPSGAPAQGAPLDLDSPAPVQGRGEFQPHHEDHNLFDSMLESLEFQGAARPQRVGPPGASTAGAAPRTSVVQTMPGANSRTEQIFASVPIPEAPAPAPAPLSAPQSPPAKGSHVSTLSSTPSAHDNPFAASAMTSGMFREEEKLKERELLDLRERIVVAERNGQEQAELRAALQNDLAAARIRINAFEGATSLSGQHMAEELAARDRELAERTAQLERFSAETEQRMEQAESSFGERMRRAREDHDAALSTLRQASQRERAEQEAQQIERLRELQAAHQRELAAVKLAQNNVAAESASLHSELETLRAQAANFERERRELEVSFDERLATATDEARRPLEEELGSNVERHARALAEQKRTTDAELARAQHVATEALARSSGFESRLTEIEQSLYATLQRATHLDQELGATKHGLEQAKAVLSATEASLETRSRELESVRSELEAARSELALREDLVVKTRAKAAASEEELRRAESIRAVAEQKVDDATRQLEQARADAAAQLEQARADAATQLEQARVDAAARDAEIARAAEQSATDAAVRRRLDEEKQAAETRAAAAEGEVARIRGELSQWDELVTAANAKASAADSDIARARADAVRATAAQEESEKALRLASEELQKFQAETTRLRDELVRATEDRDGLVRRVTEEAVGREAELARQRDEAARVREEHARTLAHLESQAATLRETRSSVATLEEKVRDLEVQRRDADAQRDSVRLRVEKLRGSLAALTRDLDDERTRDDDDGNDRTKIG